MTGDPEDRGVPAQSGPKREPTQDPERGRTARAPLDEVPEVSAPGPRRDDEIEQISLLGLANVLLRRWKLVIGLPIAAVLAAAVISLLIAPKFTATATFVPETQGTGSSLPGGLAGLASQIGVRVPSGGESPEFYTRVLESRTVRDRVLLATFQDPRADSPGDSATFLEILQLTGETESEQLADGRKQLEELTSLRVDNQTNIVTVSVETRYTILSADVANLYVELLNRFNLETRQTKARERRRFVESRIREAEQELAADEEQLKIWLEGNRQFENSPELHFQYERLQRRIRIKEEVVTTLRREYEEARIQEVNDTPVITVIDKALPPQEKSSPKRKLNVILAFLLGGVLALFGAFGQEFLERAREQERDEYQEFASRWQGIKSELRSIVWRRPRA